MVGLKMGACPRASPDGLVWAVKASFESTGVAVTRTLSNFQPSAHERADKTMFELG
jgi:hypothetical protein